MACSEYDNSMRNIKARDPEEVPVELVKSGTPQNPQNYLQKSFLNIQIGRKADRRNM